MPCAALLRVAHQKPPVHIKSAQLVRSADDYQYGLGDDDDGAGGDDEGDEYDHQSRVLHNSVILHMSTTDFAIMSVTKPCRKHMNENRNYGETHDSPLHSEESA